MNVRAVLIALCALALLAPARSSFAQRGALPRSGVIKSVDETAKTFVVTLRGRGGMERDATVKTDDKTVFGKGTEAGTFAELKPGRFAVVMGTGNPETGITATEVIVLEKAVTAAFGTVKSADAANKAFVVLMGPRQGGQQREVTIKVLDATKYTAGTAAAKFEDVAAGKRVLVIGEGNPREGVSALIVRILPAEGGGNQ